MLGNFFYFCTFRSATAMQELFF